MNEPVVVPAGEPIPAGLSSKAKLIGNLITAIVGIATSGAALALVPNDVVADETILSVGGIVTLAVGAWVTYYTSNALTAPISYIPDDIPGKHEAL